MLKIEVTKQAYNKAVKKLKKKYPGKYTDQELVRMAWNEVEKEANLPKSEVRVEIK